MFKMGCSMARRILGPGSTASGNQDQAGTCFSAAPSSASGQDNSRKLPASKGGQMGCKTASGDSDTASNANSNKPSQPSSELNDFSKLEDDPRLPLNVRQIFKITKSWKAIARTMSKTGTAMFLNLFEQNQDLFYLFDRFQHLKGKELHESMELREHAATVMATLDTSINSLSDYDNFVSYLHSIGQLHRKVPGFKREYFWKIEQPFMKAVKQTLDERCNETIEEIYKIAIKLIIETIAEGYGQESDAAGRANNSSRSARGDADGTNKSQEGSGQSPGDIGKGNNNSNTNNNNNRDNNNNAGKSYGRGRQAGGAFDAGKELSTKQDQQTPDCNSSSAKRVGHDRDNPEVISETRAQQYSLAKRTLSKIVVLTKASLQWRQRRRAKLASHLIANSGCESFAHCEPHAHGAELILATCELMNTTRKLIDSCESYADELGDQPGARAARKLTGWRSLLVNLNCSLTDENEHSQRQDSQPGVEVNSTEDQQWRVGSSGLRRDFIEMGDNLRKQSGLRGPNRSGMQREISQRENISEGRGKERNLRQATGDDDDGDGDDLAKGANETNAPNRKQTKKTEQDSAATNDDDEEHNRVKVLAKQEHSSRAAAGEKELSSRTVDSFGSQATNSTTGRQLESVVVVVGNPTSSSSDSSSCSSCVTRPTLSCCRSIGKRTEPHRRESLLGKDNENLSLVSRDSSSPGQSGVNELSEASSIKISAAAASEKNGNKNENKRTKAKAVTSEAPALARQAQGIVAESKCSRRSKLVWNLNGVCSLNGARRQSSTLLSTLAESCHHGDNFNGGGECDYIGNYSAIASSVNVGQNQNSNQSARFRAAVLLHKGETSVDRLLRDIEQRETYPNDCDTGDLIEFIKVIILINKLILALASSSIRATTISTTNGSAAETTTFCKTTLVN